MIIDSSIKSYKVEFNSFKSFLKKNYRKNDLIICDKYFRKKNIFNSSFKTIYLDANEKTKSFENLPNLIKKIINAGIDKKTTIFSIGGGVIQDVSSFISSIIFRGIKWNFIPTTLIAMGDSCIGGKTSINFYKYKNQVGNFYPPENILIDTNFLNSLPNDQITSGLGELAHYFLVKREFNIDYLDKILDKRNYNTLTHKDFRKLITNALRIKKTFIEIDEFDKKERLILNFGHTFGHALESYFDYRILHGCAITIGMRISIYISMRLNFIKESEAKYLDNILKKIYHDKILPINKINISKYSKILLKDKKTENNLIRPIMTKGVGRMFIKNIKIDKNFKSYLSDFFTAY